MPMHLYLTQLITDMRQAASNQPPKTYCDIPPETGGIEYVIEWENAKSKPMQEWLGISKENFPPPETLTDDQLAMMLDEILKLWATWRLYPNLPGDLPTAIAYKVLTDFFDKPIAWVSQGGMILNLCDLDTDNCPFTKAYCKCKDLVDESDMATGKDCTERLMNCHFNQTIHRINNTIK